MVDSNPNSKARDTPGLLAPVPPYANKQGKNPGKNNPRPSGVGLQHGTAALEVSKYEPPEGERVALSEEPLKAAEPSVCRT